MRLLVVLGLALGAPHHGHHHAPSEMEESARLGSIYENYDEAPLFDHWAEYAPHYERHLPRPCSHRRRQQADSNASGLCDPVKMLEIGVQSGGSTRIWRKYYGDQLRYVGVDINAKCKRSESLEEHIKIEIGSQLDKDFLDKVCKEHGPFDVVVDDGGHTFDMINTTLHILWPNPKCLKPHAVYAVEDLHAMNMCDMKVAGMPYCDSPAQFQSLLGELYSSILFYWDGKADGHQNAKRSPHPVWGNKIKEIHLYDSLMFLLHGDHQPITRINKGYDKIPYS